ncbi:MAG: PD-(D/E)XK nuclease family protein [Bacteroidia bacterium]|nr:PD-(D/E)XK nuclease family protein [Bacteroidia bacterium]
MQAFLNLIAHHIHTHYKDSVENVCIVLPSKRGSVFLKDHFKQVFTKTTWLPDIQSAEEFIEALSGLKQADEIDLIAFLYESYLACLKGEPEPFDKFSKWGHLMIQDFNEIDRYLVDSRQIYNNLTDIKEIENWSLGQEDLSTTQINYLNFMGSIGDIYVHFSQELLKKGIGYQGLIYKKASENFKDHPALNKYSKILFCGFNALNAAETKIYTWLQSSGKAEMLWDIDNYYYKDKTQEAGLFLRRNLEVFDAKQNSFTAEHYKTAKEIHITAVAGQMGQAQLVHDELIKLINNGVSMTKVAVVLANERLLWPVLKLLPKEVEHVNITMEYPIRYTQAYSFIDLLFNIQVNFQNKGRSSGSVYFKEFIAVLQHPFFGVLLKSLDQKFNVSAIIDQINKDNFVFIHQKYIQEKFRDLPKIISEIFKPWPSSLDGNNSLVSVIDHIRNYYIKLFETNIIHLELEYMEVLLRSFHRINDVLQKYPMYYADVRSYRQLYTQTVGAATVPFIGEPLKGLQIMGVLETRTLDFEYLIMVGVNEGVLPSGKTVNSFLPNDLKRLFGLPLYYEKDAIYAYHFYRLLQRSSFVHLIYDSETDEFGKGEKSRFISQLQFELKHYHPDHQITEGVAVSASPVYVDDTISIEKNEQTLEKILTKARSSDEFGGISPSALNTFKECSLKFYYRYGAGLKEIKEVEESAEANTFGSILHLALENLYKPYINKNLAEEDLLKMLSESEKEVEKAFKEFFKDSSPLQGKNYLQIEVLKVYVKRLIDLDKENVKSLKKQNKFLKILFLESPWKAPLQVTINNKQETFYVQGKIDRIDDFGGKIRVIDYKNSVKDSDKFTFTNFETVFEDINYNKQLQLFIYVWLVYKNKPEYLKRLQPGIIPFKKFLKKPKQIVGADKQDLEFSTDLMNDMENHLSAFVGQIVDISKPFGQTDDLKICEFCDYKALCNR